jgi:hypothetical protein
LKKAEGKKFLSAFFIFMRGARYNEIKIGAGAKRCSYSFIVM